MSIPESENSPARDVLPSASLQRYYFRQTRFRIVLKKLTPGCAALEDYCCARLLLGCYLLIAAERDVSGRLAATSVRFINAVGNRGGFVGSLLMGYPHFACAAQRCPSRSARAEAGETGPARVLTELLLRRTVFFFSYLLSRKPVDGIGDRDNKTTLVLSGPQASRGVSIQPAP